VEIYCSNKTDLDDWRVVNRGGEEFLLNGKCSGFFAVDVDGFFEKDDEVFLYDDGKL
ncbi:unnamed protein product, partial [marine sediment metagenome]